MNLAEKIKTLPAKEAIEYLSGIIDTDPLNEEAFTLRGKAHWSLNHRKEAINDYLTAIKINPQSKASILLEYANSILDYYNKDLLNP